MGQIPLNLNRHQGNPGISTFIAITGSNLGRAASGLRGTRTATNGAFRKAVRGFHTAFLEEIVDVAEDTAIQRACRQCADAFLAGVDEEDPKELEELRTGLETCVAEAIAALMLEAR